MSSEHMDNVMRIYECYLASLTEQLAAQNISDGLMGMGRKDDSLPCHDEFYSSLGNELARIKNSALNDTELENIVRYVLSASLQHTKSKSAYWMMLAAHSLTEELVSMLPDEAVQRLAQWYKDAYPRHERMPAQNKLLKMMQRTSDSTPLKKLFNK